MAFILASYASVLPFGIFAVVLLFLSIILLIQCAGKKENSDEIKDGQFRKHSSYEDNINQVKSQKDVVDSGTDYLSIDATEVKSRASTVNSACSNGSNVIERPKQPTPIPDRSQKDNSMSNESSNCNEKITPHKITEISKKGTSFNSKTNGSLNNSEKDKNSSGNDGSNENSGSGDSIYTKVKSVPVKEECAYSVVELASRDTEYEMVEGKLKRLEKEIKQEEKKKDTYSGYEVISSVNQKRKVSLDPVLFAVEDSGASGIYEDVPDSKVPEQQQQITRSEQNKQSNDEKEFEKPHEQKTKKWGLTRFSIKNKSKKKNDSADHIDNSGNHKGSPKSSDERSYLSDASDSNENMSERKLKQFTTRGAMLPMAGQSTPPPPPIENLRLKIDHRKTIHVTETNSDQAHVVPHRLSAAHNSSLFTDAKWPIATPNDYTVLEQKPSEVNQGSAMEDMLYEEPDKDLVAQTGKNVRSQSRNEIIPSQVNNATDYETISCDITLTDQDGKIDDRSRSMHTSNEQQESEPQYAVVDRKSTKKRNSNSPGNKVRANSGTNQTPASEINNEKKIEVFITKTNISSQLSNNSDSALTGASEIKAEDKNINDLNDPMEKQEKQEKRNDKVKNLDEMYAKVDMVQKREDQAKRALYASVNKEKTGVYKFYDEDDHVHEMTTEEFEDGHYSKVQDEIHSDADDGFNIHNMQNEETPGKADIHCKSEENEYELLTEQNTLQMFTSLRNSKGKSSNKNTTIDEAKQVIKKSVSDYEEI